ncbi:MAG: hypothetical protein ACO1QS_12685 [Verrucomicrobiota bacterium]
MQTPKQTVNDAKVMDSGGGLRIMPPGLRIYTAEETAQMREKFAAEVNAEHAGKLQTYKGIRLWWLKWRLGWEVEKRVRECKRKGI